jgi:hypothetical protein
VVSSKLSLLATYSLPLAAVLGFDIEKKEKFIKLCNTIRL